MCQGSGNWVTLTDQPAEERARVPTEQLKESNVGFKLTSGTDTELFDYFTLYSYQNAYNSLYTSTWMKNVTWDNKNSGFILAATEKEESLSVPALSCCLPSLMSREH